MTGQVTAIRPTSRSWPVWSTTAVLVVTDPAALGPAQDLVGAELDAVDRACSRFRTDSEIAGLLARPDRPVPVSPLLSEVIGQAMRVAAATDHLVDPTVAAAVIALGYDRDIAQVVTGRPDLQPAVAAPGSWRVQHDPERRTVTVPAGVGLDLGATAKPLAADRAARRVAQRLGCGALVGIGGDIAVAGEPPAGDWQVDIADDHRPGAAPLATVALACGGLATSSTTVRRWRTGSGQWRHHIVDPRTGRNPPPVWRTVAVAAGSSVDANAAATAAIVLGWQAPAWLTGSGLPALLVGEDGRRVRVAGWPDDPGSDR
jgi:thiamine biosynthesis lipoprotein